MDSFKARFSHWLEGASGQALLGEDFVFRPDDYAALSSAEILYQDISFDNHPDTISRKLLVSCDSTNPPLQLAIRLCLEGKEGAASRLLNHCGLYQRAVPADDVEVISESRGIGHLGLAWSWDGGDQWDIAAFVRHNLLVILDGGAAGVSLMDLAAGIDERVQELSITKNHSTVQDGVLASLRTDKSVPHLETMSRMDIPVPANQDEHWFFRSDRGSVSRDPADSNRFYYRAGLEPGPATIELFRVAADGVLPQRERLSIEID